MGEVKPFKMSREKMKALIKELSRDSSNITFINNCAGGDWEAIINYRQMIECLKNGEMLSDPAWDNSSNTHKCSMGYFHAGQDIVLEIAIEDNQSLYILNVCQ